MKMKKANKVKVTAPSNLIVNPSQNTNTLIDLCNSRVTFVAENKYLLKHFREASENVSYFVYRHRKIPLHGLKGCHLHKGRPLNY